MAIAEKTAQAPDIQRGTAARLRFTGRGALANLAVDSIREKAEQLEAHQIINSRMILETVMGAVAARDNIASFRAALIEESEKIAAKRKAAIPNDAPEEPKAEGRLETKRDVLLAALSMMGLKATITAEREGSQSTRYTLLCGGESAVVLLTHSVMKFSKPSDSVSQAVKELSVFSIGQRGDENEPVRMTQRRSTRPPPDQLGVGQPELDRRMVSFDGTLESSGGSMRIFQYLAKDMETSFSVPCGLSGEELLDFIDERVEEIHKCYKSPFPAALIEQRATEPAPKAYLGGLSGDMLTIARALDFLVVECLNIRGQVPEEYREAFDRLKKMEVPKTVFLNAEEMQLLSEAFNELDLPIKAIMRDGVEQEFSPDDMMGAPAQEEEAKALQLLSDSVATSLCDTALQNLADAYSLISGNNLSAAFKPSDARRDFNLIISTLRARINEFMAEGIIQTEN